MRLLCEYANDMKERILCESRTLLRQTRRRTLTEHTIEYATRLVVGDDILGRSAIVNGENHLLDRVLARHRRRWGGSAD